MCHLSGQNAAGCAVSNTAGNGGWAAPAAGLLCVCPTVALLVLECRHATGRHVRVWVYAVAGQPPGLVSQLCPLLGCTPPRLLPCWCHACDAGLAPVRRAAGLVFLGCGCRSSAVLPHLSTFPSSIIVPFCPHTSPPTCPHASLPTQACCMWTACSTPPWCTPTTTVSASWQLCLNGCHWVAARLSDTPLQLR